MTLARIGTSILAAMLLHMQTLGCVSDSSPQGEGEGGSGTSGGGSESTTVQGTGSVGTSTGSAGSTESTESTDSADSTMTDSGTDDTGGPTLECDEDFGVAIAVEHEDAPHSTTGTISYGSTRIDQLASNDRGVMASSACGDLGLLHREYDGMADTCEIVYTRFTAAGLQQQATVLQGVGHLACPIGRGLFFDDACAPHAVMLLGDELVQHSPDPGGQWQASPIMPPAGASFSSFMGVREGNDGNVYAMLEGTQGGEPGILRGAFQPDGSWSFTSYPQIVFGAEHEHVVNWPYNILLDLAIDGRGEVHAVFNDDMELGYAVTSGGEWDQTIVLPQVDNRNNTGFEASIALDSRNRPAIVASNSTHHPGWSIDTLGLYYYSRNDDGSWSSELIADQADGFFGGDGNKYTGDQVQLALDRFDQPYVVFSDLASWHETYNYVAPGQIRYAIKACGNWYHHTVFHQVGQSMSPNPIMECRHPTTALGVDGETMLFACMEREAGSILGVYDANVPLTSTLRTFVVSHQFL